MRCPSCGHDNRPERRYCAECAASLAILCAACGAQNEPAEKYCGGCGASLGGPQGEAHAAKRPAPPLPTSFAGGRYQVRRFLGEGSHKRVYLAHDERLGRDVALALIKSEGLDEAGFARIRRESRAMGRLGDHPHIVTIYDIEQEHGQTYVVSQYMSGGSVADRLSRTEKHRLPVEEALQLAEQVCRALERAHEQGVIHRDLKPANIWLTPDGTAKLGDFGLAAMVDHPRLTLEGMIVGTLNYMAPEQALGRPPDARSDLYAVGVMLYEMVTGRPPFLGEDAVAIISQHINTNPVAPSWHNPEVPPALEALILRLLAKAPEDRLQSANAVLQALAEIAAVMSAGVTPHAPGEVNQIDRLASGVFVGREREVRGLHARLDEALSGRGQLVLLAGEPGIGKTRTAEEFATYARLRNAQVLWGRCYEGEGAPAFWPWVQIIRAYVHNHDPAALLSTMGPGAADIAQVVSEVRERLPGLPLPPAVDPEQARFRLFESVTTFLKNAAGRQPLVLVIDDLHWADKPSLLLLEFLARELGGARLLALGTYRDVALTRKHPLVQTLGALPRGERFVLRGLAEQDVSRFIELIAGLVPAEPLVAAVYRETEGNPFFVTEVVHLLAADGRLEHTRGGKSWSVDIPQSVREVVGRRLDRLSPECNAVLTIASVIGREFGLDVLEHVSDVSGDRLVEVLEEAAAARVLVEVPRAVGHYTFGHALIRETLYEELSTARRVRLHQRIGEVLEQLYGTNPTMHLPELAYHFYEGAQGGGDAGKAVDYAARAGERAAVLLAYEEAASHYERALQALTLREPIDEARRCGLLLALGETRNKGGDRDGGRETLLQAAAVARQLGAPAELARAALVFGGLWARFGTVDEALIGLLNEALDTLGKGDDSLRARVLGRLAVELYYSERRDSRVPLIHQAVDMARQLGDPATLAYALRARVHCLWGADDPEGRLADVDELLRLAEESGARELAVEAHTFRVSVLLELGDVRAVDAEIALHARLAEELRQPFYLWYVKLFQAMRLILDGRFEQGEQLALEALNIGQRLQNEDAFQSFGVQLSILRMEQGRSLEMESQTQAFAEAYPALPAWRCARALLCAYAGRAEEARSEIKGLARRDFAEFPRDANWLVGMVFLALACWILDDAEHARVLYPLLLPYAGRNVVVGVGFGCWGPVSGYLGALAATMDRWEEAQAHFEAALETSRRLGSPPWIANVQHFHARMLLGRSRPGDREKALELISLALDTARALGMKRLLEWTLADKLKAQGLGQTSLSTSLDAVVSVVTAERPDLRRHAAIDGTVTILFTDIEGFTTLTERLGDHHTQEILRAHNAIVRRQVTTHDGVEVKSQGDGFMIAFSSARRAMLCAIAIQRAIGGLGDRYPDACVRIRCGIHTGEAIQEADDFFGKSVIVAARVAAAACGGEILVSALVRELTQSGGDFTFGEGRAVKLKGLSGTYQLHDLAWHDRGAREGAAARARETP